MKRKRPARASSAPITLGSDDYDPEGRPKGRLSIGWHELKGADGQQYTWVAEYDDLPGYFGEGATVSEALDRLWIGLGSRPHFRVDIADMTQAQLERSIEQKHRAEAAAATSRVHNGMVIFGGGAATDASAKEFAVGKPVVNAARKALNEAITHHDASHFAGEYIANVSAVSLRAFTNAAMKRSRLEIGVARCAPWRIKHMLARAKFPAKSDEFSAGPDFGEIES